MLKAPYTSSAARASILVPVKQVEHVLLVLIKQATQAPKH
jgi:hypothetical protein